MATDATKIIVGAGTFSIGDYTSSGGAGSLTDVGHVKSPFELGSSYENFDVTTERATGIVKTVPLNDSYTLKVYMHEATGEHMRIILGQPSARLSGTSPDDTLLVGDESVAGVKVKEVVAQLRCYVEEA